MADADEGAGGEGAEDDDKGVGDGEEGRRTSQRRRPQRQGHEVRERNMALHQPSP